MSKYNKISPFIGHATVSGCTIPIPYHSQIRAINTWRISSGPGGDSSEPSELRQPVREVWGGDGDCHHLPIPHLRCAPRSGF
jgi:hypothetical protein